ncbi:MAG TPA: hypothetical protein VE860_12175 [Chthoniobacterales bacterium]|nr:hypothetical protein [Chthoniobacterales bacterium]
MLDQVRTMLDLRIDLSGRFVGSVIALAAFISWPAFAQNAAAPGLNPEVNPDNQALRGRANVSASSAVKQPQIDPIEVQRCGQVAQKIVDRIQTAERDLYMRLSYFEKPARLDPNSYASKDEVVQWQAMLHQLKDQDQRVEQLYADIGRDLETGLRNAGANEDLVASLKKFIFDGMPWDIIEKKKNSIADFISEHERLLTLYQNNWGSWTGGKSTKAPEFASAAVSTAYKKLREQIVSTGGDIEKEYSAMSQ